MGNIYKLLVADDEYWIREQIRILLNWENYSIEFLEPASDGEEVLRRVEMEKPDIIVTDINMPFMNGVELLQKMRQAHPDIVTIIISGYSDFHYVKEGLLAGAIDYILKPVSKMDLIKALTAALDIVNEKRLYDEKKQYERNQLRKASSVLMDREFSEVITKEKHGTNKNKIIQHAIMNSNILPEGGYCFMVAKIHNINAVADIFGHDRNLLSFTIKQQLKEKLKEHAIFIFNNIYASSEYVIGINVEEREVLELAYAVLFLLKEFTNHVISIGVSERHFAEAEFSLAYEEAKIALLNRIPSDSSKVNVWNAKTGNKSIEIKITQRQENQLLRLLKEEPSMVKKFIFSTIGLENCRQEEWTIFEIKKTIQKICNIMNTCFVKQMKEEMELENMEDTLLHVIEDNNYELFASMLEDFLDMILLPDMEENAFASGKETIKAIYNYIESNYYEEITLNNLAKKYHMESSYLSKLFKKETGNNLIYFISEKRVEKAKEMMRNGNLTLTEIAFSVGYDDYNYFNKVFRKMVGISPRDYRINSNSNI